MTARVTLFIPCYVRHLRPATAANLIALLERLGVAWELPPDQTCCGQPSFNAGYWHEAARCAAQLITRLQGAERVVTPSASCAAMVQRYAELRELGPELQERGRALAARTRELCSFLVDDLGVVNTGARFDGAVAYHDACHALNDLGIRDQPRALLRQVRGLELRELPGAPRCCGFGGTFSVKYPEISVDMADAKLRDLEACGTDTLVSTDVSCLLHLEGRARRQRLPFRGLHVVDVLAGAG